MALFYSTMEIGTSFVLFWGASSSLLPVTIERVDLQCSPELAKCTKARSHTVHRKVLKLCLEGFQTLEERAMVAEASTDFLTS